MIIAPSHISERVFVLLLPVLRTNEAFHSTTDTRCACRSEMSEHKVQGASGDRARWLIYHTPCETLACDSKTEGFITFCLIMR